MRAPGGWDCWGHLTGRAAVCDGAVVLGAGGQLCQQGLPCGARLSRQQIHLHHNQIFCASSELHTYLYLYPIGLEAAAPAVTSRRGS